MNSSSNALSSVYVDVQPIGGVLGSKYNIRKLLDILFHHIAYLSSPQNIPLNEKSRIMTFYGSFYTIYVYLIASIRNYLHLPTRIIVPMAVSELFPFPIRHREEPVTIPAIYYHSTTYAYEDPLFLDHLCDVAMDVYNAHPLFTINILIPVGYLEALRTLLENRVGYQREGILSKGHQPFPEASHVLHPHRFVFNAIFTSRMAHEAFILIDSMLRTRYRPYPSIGYACRLEVKDTERSYAAIYRFCTEDFYRSRPLIPWVPLGGWTKEIMDHGGSKSLFVGQEGIYFYREWRNLQRWAPLPPHGQGKTIPASFYLNVALETLWATLLYHLLPSEGTVFPLIALMSLLDRFYNIDCHSTLLWMPPLKNLQSRYNTNTRSEVYTAFLEYAKAHYGPYAGDDPLQTIMAMYNGMLVSVGIDFDDTRVRKWCHDSGINYMRMRDVIDHQNYLVKVFGKKGYDVTVSPIPMYLSTSVAREVKKLAPERVLEEDSTHNFTWDRANDLYVMSLLIPYRRAKGEKVTLVAHDGEMMVFAYVS